MKFKLDENLGASAVQLFREFGHDALTVRDQRLAGISDPQLLNVCRDEQRALVTLDVDFANPLIFNPQQHHGIAVLRLPPRVQMPHMLTAVRTLLLALQNQSLDHKLWIVELGRIREYQPTEEAE